MSSYCVVHNIMIFCYLNNCQSKLANRFDSRNDIGISKWKLYNFSGRLTRSFDQILRRKKKCGRRFCFNYLYKLLTLISLGNRSALYLKRRVRKDVILTLYCSMSKISQINRTCQPKLTLGHLKNSRMENLRNKID